MPGRTEDEDYSGGEGEDGGIEEEESEHSSLSEASDHIPGGNDETSSHVSDPTAIKAAGKQAASNVPNKRGTKKKAAKENANDSEDEVSISDDGSEEESAESDKNDDEDYQDEVSDEDEESFHDDDEDEDEDDDDDFGATTRKRKTPARKKTTKRSPPTRKPPTRKPPPRKAPGKKAPARNPPPRPNRAATGKPTVEEESSNSEEEESDEFEETPTRRSRNTRGSRHSPRRQYKKRASYKDVGSSGDEGSDDSHSDKNENAESNDDEESNSDEGGKQSTASGRRPSRASAAKATAKMAQLRYKLEQENSDDEEEEEEEAEVMPKPKSRKKKIDSDEEEFQIDDDNPQDQDDDDEVVDDAKSSADESFLEGVHSVPSDHQAVGNADSSDFCENELSDDEGGDGKKPSARIGRKPAAANPVLYHSSSDDDETEIEPTPTKARLSQKERSRPANRQSKNSTPKLSQCPSETDAITMDKLPPIHVCYVSPDGKSRQCFSLETLHRIATMSPHPQYRSNLSDEQQLTFLQPPVFRSAMSDELIDQIASRFGRQALDLNGVFYNKNKATKPAATIDEHFPSGEDYQVNFTRVHTDQSLFMHSWRDYQLRNMGAQDLYPCPVCYAVAHDMLKASPSEKKQIVLPQEFSYDPMTVLGSLDNEDFQIAASFCFTKIAKVKEHLRKVHKCNTAHTDNAVFFRYKVRAPDGLLQRFLSNSKTYGRNPRQGDMRRYWYEGNSENYVYLLYQLEQLQHNLLANDADSDSPNNKSATGPLEASRQFFSSFQDQAEDLWERIRAPFSGKEQDNLKDFFNDEEEEEDEDVPPHHVFDREQAASSQQDDEELARYYKEQAEKDENDDSSQYADENEEDAYQQVEASESEEDEWVAGIRNKKKRSSYETPARVNGRGKATGGRRLSARKRKRSNEGDSSDDDDLEMSEAPSAKKRAILEDSDSD